MKDLQELAIDIDATDWRSGVNLEVIRQLANGDLEVAFDVVAGHLYILEMTSDLSDPGGWEEVSQLTATDNPRQILTTPFIFGDSVFWRVGVR